MNYSLLRSLLFKLPAEKAHALALGALNYLPHFCFPKTSGQPVQVMGMTFPHALGLAAGLDKNGDYLKGLAKLGLAFIELGTVTPKPQPGNPQPRLFRLPQAQALINRMGFNNDGVEALVRNVERAEYEGILGINIGKNKETPLMQAADDYLYCLNKVYMHASYITVNISSPNTPDLRQLQQGDFFDSLLQKLCAQQKILTDTHQRHIPLVVKISPDESEETIKRLADCAIRHHISGIIATNTTCSRPQVEAFPASGETGGLSGRPLAPLALDTLKLLKKETGDALTLIGVGGIDSPESAAQRLKAGADLLQIYTGMIYQGPGLVGQIKAALTKHQP